MDAGDADIVFVRERLHGLTGGISFCDLALLPDLQRRGPAEPHSHASHMLASKIHPKAVQERLGHSSIAITMDIYSHLMPNMQGEAAAAVDGVLRAALNKASDVR